MSTFGSIIKVIEGLKPDAKGDLTLTPVDFGLPFVDSVFGVMLGAASVTIAGANRVSASALISVAGTADVLGYTDLTVVLTFAEVDGEVVATLDATFAATRTITLPLVTWLQAGSIRLHTSITESFELVSLGFGMDILLQNADTIPIALTRTAASEWRLDVAEGTDKGVTGKDVVYLLGGEALDSFLPPELTKVLDGFSITGIAALFDTQEKTVTYFSTAVTVTNGWEIAPKVRLKPGLQIALTLVSPTDKDARSAIGLVTATFDLAGVEVPISIGASVASGGSVWTFGLQTGKTVHLPKFSDLLSLAGGEDFAATLPANLADLPAIDVTTLIVAFDSARKDLTQLSFALKTASPWTVIEGYFVVKALQIGFDITGVTDAKTRQVYGDLYASFSVGSVPLMCELKKTRESPDWTITAGLVPGTTLNLTEIAAQLFEGQAKPPADTPQIAFDALSIVVVPAQKSFEFKASSDSSWRLIGDTLAIDRIGLDFTRSVTDGTGKVTGEVSCTLDVAGVELDLKASLNDTKAGGWSFSGEQGTKPIPVGSLIDDLARKFDSSVTLPPVLSGLEVRGLGVSFDTSNKDFTFKCTLKDTAISALTVDLSIAITHKGTDNYTSKFKGKATYASDDVSLTFDLDLTEAVDGQSGTTTTVASYVATKPPTLAQLVQLVATELGFDADIPQGLNFDAALTALKLKLVKTDKDPLRVDGAGLFELTVGSDEPWRLYLSYTNDTYFQNLGKKSRADGPDGKPAYVFGIALGGALDLKKLPLVGSIPGVDDFRIDKLGFYYTDAPFTKDEAKLVFAVAELDKTASLAPTPAAAFLDQPKFNLMALFGSGSATADAEAPKAMPLGTDTGTPPNGSAPAFAPRPADPRKPVSWLPVNKTLGPVEIDKVGLGYEAPPKGAEGILGIVGLYVDGAFSVAGLTMILDRLGITFPIPMPGKDVKNPMSLVGFHLGGMFLEYKTPGFEVAGGFVNLGTGDDVNMIGEFTVQFGPYGVQAYGGYANTLGHPSLFIFLHLEAPLGGPPFFFVTGVSGGFGVNRGFTLPTFDELGSYPLLPGAPAIPTAADLSGKSNQDKLSVMTQSLLGLAKYFPVEEGEYWFAVGLDVTSFEMVEVSAILSVAFGVNLQIAVIGSAAISIPPKAEPEPVAYIQINFMVSYSSADNLLAVVAVITPASFIYGGLIKISGGFAFYTWLGGPNQGDFVLTVGGYNARYVPPPQYPRVPRLEMRAGIGPVNMVGRAYFALLPQMLMAGLDIKATADLGPIQAWFDASVDFLFAWKPFHYEARIAVQLGASFTIDLGFVKAKISIHVGVMLEVWGPEFGGRATVDLDIISVTVSFGAKPVPAPALAWSQFQDFLPSVPAGDPGPKPLRAGHRALARAALIDEAAEADPPKADNPLVEIQVKAGLVKSYAPGAEVDGLNWLVDANHFDIRSHSAAPANHVVYNLDPLPADYDYLTPGDLRAQIQSPAHKDQPVPLFVYETPAGQTKWDEIAYGIPPMKLTGVAITHNVTMKRLTDVASAPPTGAALRRLTSKVAGGVEDVIVTLTNTGVPPSLWGTEPVSTIKPPKTDDTAIRNALVGLQFTPMIRLPKRTTFIPYYYLVFDTNNLFLEQDSGPVLDETPFVDPAAIYADMQDGAAFRSTEATRSGVVGVLAGLGFGHLDPANAAALSTRDYVDDPRLMHMSSQPQTRAA